MNNTRNTQWESEYEQMSRVRGYSQSEREIVDSEPNNPQERIIKIQNVMEIDQNRYRDFKESNPDQSAHMDKLIEACTFFAEAMKHIYQQDYGIVFSETGELCPEDTPKKDLPTLLNVEFINRPA